MTRPLALVTGASSGIGAVYAERLARRGHDLLLVARDLERLTASAERLAGAHGILATPLAANLASRPDLARVIERIRDDESIGMLVNSAGIGPSTSALGSLEHELDHLVELNVNALHALTITAAKAFAHRGAGAIVNIASVVALMPEKFNASYAASKAFVLVLTQALAAELAGTDVRIQAVLPGFTRTELFERSGVDIDRIPAGMMMGADELVDAALAGFDAGELVTIPSLEDPGLWADLEAARGRLAPHLSLDRPARRYLERA